MNTVFSQAINETFPQLEQSLRGEIVQSVSVHMLEFLKEGVFKNDPVTLKGVNDKLALAPDKNQTSKEYGESITKKLLSLSENEQQIISDKMDAELTRVMHQIYLSVKDS